MATRFYLNNSTPPFVPATIKGAWNAIPGSFGVMMGTTKFGGEISSVGAFENVATQPWSVFVIRGISSELQTQTISGDIDVILGVLESNADANFFWHIHVYVTVGDTDAVRGTLLNNYKENSTNEWVATPAKGIGLQVATSLTSVNAISGDRIVVELGYIARNITTASRTGTIYYGTQTGVMLEDAANLAIGGLADIGSGSINFTQTILFEITPQQVAHVAIQAAETDTTSASQIAHAVNQVAGHVSGSSRVSHVVIQVARGTIFLTDISGIYFVNPISTHDSYYNNVLKKIPNPTIKTALLGE